MPIVAWTPEMSVGVDSLDTDHKMILSLINRLHDAIDDGEGQHANGTTIGSVLNALLDYTEYHFGREEALMAACGCPDLEQHKEFHGTLKKKLIRIRDSYKAGQHSIGEPEVMEFLRNWLTDHIMGRDKSYQPRMDANRKAVEKADAAFTKSL